MVNKINKTYYLALKQEKENLFIVQMFKIKDKFICNQLILMDGFHELLLTNLSAYKFNKDKLSMLLISNA